MDRISGAHRRIQARRGPTLAAAMFQVIAASPYPDEPDDTNYRPSLLVRFGPVLEEESRGAATTV